VGRIGRGGEIGPTRDYWISGLAGRDTAAGKFASVSADSHAIRQTRHTASEHFGVSAGFEPTPAVIDQETWSPNGTTKVSQLLTLSFANVSRASVNTVRAKLRCATIRATTDGDTALTLLRRHSRSTVRLTRGTTTLHMCRRRRRRASRRL
jgi:hypothetical protein